MKRLACLLLIGNVLSFVVAVASHQQLKEIRLWVGCIHSDAYRHSQELKGHSGRLESLEGARASHAAQLHLANEMLRDNGYPALTDGMEVGPVAEAK